MTIWHERRGADLILRLSGMFLLGCAWLLGTWMASLVRSRAPHDATPLEMVVTMLMFVAGSLGTATLALGKHLFDKVQVSERWVTRDNKAESRTRPSE
ncbi:hypothetical protein BH10PSE13_BH10PSE13_19200 [soil metagenome]